MENTNYVKVNDIANDLVIINKTTLDRLCQLENAGDCIALYVFLYKTGKWQKTNTVKANNTYIQKCLKWSKGRVEKTKNILTEQKFIQRVVRRGENGKIKGWFLQVNYLQKDETDCTQIKSIIESQPEVDFTTTGKNATGGNYNKLQNQQVENTTSGEMATNTLNNKLSTVKDNLNSVHSTLSSLNNNDVSKRNIKEKTDPKIFETIIEYLNNKTGMHYKHTTSKTQSLINARLNEGFTISDFYTVIDKKCQDWLNDPKWSKYLRPETLFGTKFESYLNQPEKEVTTKDLPVDEEFMKEFF